LGSSISGDGVEIISKKIPDVFRMGNVIVRRSKITSKNNRNNRYIIQ
jgi:hypothetical protein